MTMPTDTPFKERPGRLPTAREIIDGKSDEFTRLALGEDLTMPNEAETQPYDYVARFMAHLSDPKFSLQTIESGPTGGATNWGTKGKAAILECLSRERDTGFWLAPNEITLWMIAAAHRAGYVFVGATADEVVELTERKMSEPDTVPLGLAQWEAIRAAVPQPPTVSGDEAEAAAIASSVAEVVKEGTGFWRSCSGCYDTEDGHPTQKYLFSEIFSTEIGCGCGECGGIGAVWDNTDYEDMANFIREEDAKEDLQANTVATLTLAERKWLLSQAPQHRRPGDENIPPVRAEASQAACEIIADILRIGSDVGPNGEIIISDAARFRMAHRLAHIAETGVLVDDDAPSAEVAT